MAMMPTVMVMMASPAHLGGCRFGILLNRRRRAGTGQRERMRTLARRGHNEHRANCRKPQNFRHLHLLVLLGSLDVTSATTGSKGIKPLNRDADRKKIADDVNVV
jgi:hypothetical protein